METVPQEDYFNSIEACMCVEASLKCWIGLGIDVSPWRCRATYFAVLNGRLACGVTVLCAQIEASVLGSAMAKGVTPCGKVLGWIPPPTTCIQSTCSGP